MAMGRTPILPQRRYQEGIEFFNEFHKRDTPASRPAGLLFLLFGFLGARIPGRSDLQQCLLVFRIHCSRHANALRGVLPVFLRFQQRCLLSPRTLQRRLLELCSSTML
jgi:hypothetical protein